MKKFTAALLILTLILCLPPTLARADDGEAAVTALIVDARDPLTCTDGDGMEINFPVILDSLVESTSGFVENLISDSSEDQIAVFSFSREESYREICSLTSSRSELNDALNSIMSTNTTDLCTGLSAAYESLSGMGFKINIVMVTTGVPNAGDGNDDGPYSEEDCGAIAENGICVYALANQAYAKAQELMENCKIYSVRILPETNADSDVVRLAEKLMRDCQNSGYYEATGDNLAEVLTQVAKDINGETVEVEESIEGIYFSNKLFEGNPNEFVPSLATVSLQLCNAAMDGNAENLMGKLGMGGIESHNLESCGVTLWLSSKEMKDGKLVTVILAGNPDMDISAAMSMSDEFADAVPTEISKKIKPYIKEQSIQNNIKLLITGYGVGGAAAGLTAVALNNSDMITDDGNIFVYTFAAPAVPSVNYGPDDFPNIYNILNQSDPVAYTPGARPGRTLYFAEGSVIMNYRAKSLAHELDKANLHNTDSAVLCPADKCTLNQGYYMSQAFDYLTDPHVLAELPAAKKLVSSLRAFCGGVQSNKVNDIELTNALNTSLSNIWDEFARSALTGNIEDAKSLLHGCLSPFAINSVAEKLAEDLTGFFCQYPEEVTTFALNLPSFIEAHDPDSYLTNIMSTDPNFTQDPVELISGGFRVLKVDCPVDVEIVDKSRNVVASIENEEVFTSETSLPVYVSRNGEKVIVLPNSGEYDISISAYSDGEVDISMETHTTSGIDKTVYETVNLKKESKINATIPNSGNELSSSNSSLPKLSGETTDYCSVTLEYDDTLGTVTGSTFTEKGGHVEFIATAKDGAEFKGWYIDNELVSNDYVYRFRVTENTELTALFEKKSSATYDEPDEKDDTDPDKKDEADKKDDENKKKDEDKPKTILNVLKVSGGTVNAAPAEPKAGELVSVRATPADGWELTTISVTDSQGESVGSTTIDDLTLFSMPEDTVTVAAVFVKQVLPFRDIPSAGWYNDDVWYVYRHGLMTGKEVDRFAPSDTVTRAEAAAVLWRMDGCLKTDNLLKYPDVPRLAWHTEAIRWATATGTVTGRDDGLFAPNDVVTREQLALMLYRFSKYLGVDLVSTRASISGYTDSAAVSLWASDAMNWAVGTGLLQGDGERLNPGDTTTRAELAALLHRFHVTVYG